MSSDGLSVEYENGVADVLAHLAGTSASVERDVLLDGFDSEVKRQLDIVVRGTIFGMTDATLVVDCKRWNSKVDVADAGAFADLVEDVRADFGLLITSKGSSPAAQRTLKKRRGMRVDVMSLEELNRWSPTGTRFVTYRVPKSGFEAAAAAMRRRGFRVRVDSGWELSDDEVALEGFRHYPIDEVPHLFGPMDDALRSVGIEPDGLSSGVVGSGGTPNHRWLMVTVDGVEIGTKVLAADEAELAEQLKSVREMFMARGLDTRGIDIDVQRPEGWPAPPRMFG